MPLVKLDKQPVILDPPSGCVNCGDICYCQKFAKEDFLRWQGKQSPCGEDLICTPDALQNLITNGTFFGPTAWVFGADWTFSLQDTTHVAGVGNTNSLYQTGLSLVFGKTYQIRWTVTGATAGTTRPFLGNEANFGSLEAGNGSFFQEIVYSASDPWAGLKPSADFDGSIDNVSVLEKGCIEADSGWSLIDGKFHHSPGFTGALTYSNITIVAAHLYNVKIKVSGSTDGTIQVYAGGSLETISSNGTFLIWLTADVTDSDFKLIPDTDFDGDIELVELYELSQDFKAYLLDENDNIVKELEISYYKDWLTIIENWNNLSLSYGCYKLAILDPCGTVETSGSELVTNGTFTGNANGWTAAGTAEYDDDNVLFSPGGSGTLTQSKTIAAGCYLLTFTISDYTDGYITPTVGGVAGTAVSANGTYQQVLKLPTSGNNIVFTGTGAGCHIDDISLKASECYNHVSNCLCYRESWDCNYLMTGYHDNEAFGFEFSQTGFSLSQRLAYTLFNSSSEDDTDDYIYSNGVHEDNFAQIEEKMQLFVEKVPEFVHRAIMTTRRCKHFFISDDGTDVLKEYYVYKGNYVPEYIKNTLIREAPARFDVSKKGGVGFASNCS